jgi:hypothetical protein
VVLVLWVGPTVAAGNGLEDLYLFAALVLDQAPHVENALVAGEALAALVGGCAGFACARLTLSTAFSFRRVTVGRVPGSGRLLRGLYLRPLA